MKALALVVSLCSLSALAQSVTVRSTDGKTQAAVQTTDPSSGTAGVVARVVPNASIAQPVSQSGSWSLSANQSVNAAQMGGTATATGNGTTSAGTLRVTLSSDSTGQVNAVQSGTWNVGLSAGSNTIGAAKITDGTNTAAVKAASTAAVGGDTALVVAISPNNTVAATQSGTWTVQPGNTPNTTAWLVTQGGNTATYNTQASVTTSAAALATQSLKSLCAKALSANTDVIYIGSSSGVTSSNGFPLYPGDTWCGSVSNANLVFAIAATGTQTLTEFGTN